ncbi:MAG TPA: beta-ketoacyl-[acyl-carrier-protein] synthase II, partial [Gemmatimonadaceae bacterium]
VNAHGTSTIPNDKLETAALKAALGNHAYKVAVSSTKSMTGHMLGAAGAVEFIIGALAVRDCIIPPTINYQHPDPELDLNYTPNTAVNRQVKAVLSNSFGFGGHNVTLAIKRFEE